MDRDLTPDRGDDLRPVAQAAIIGLLTFGLDLWVSYTQRWVDARRRKRAAAAAAAADPDVPPEPGPGLWRCRSPRCGYRFWRGGPGRDARWFGPIFENGETYCERWRTWEDIDASYGDCTGHRVLIPDPAPPWPGWDGIPKCLPD